MCRGKISPTDGEYTMIKPKRILVFILDEQRYGLDLDAVDRVVRAVAVTLLPDAPEVVLGIINVQGRIVPVINMRNCFRLHEGHFYGGQCA